MMLIVWLRVSKLQDFVKRGQCVAMALPNSIEFVVTLLAVNQVGAFISLINPVYTYVHMY